MKRKIGKHTVVAEASPRHHDRLESLLATLTELDQAGPRLRAGSTVHFGWARLELRPSADQLVVHAPGLSLDTVFDVLVAQLALTQTLGLEPVDAPAGHTLILRRGVLEKQRIFAKRDEPEGEHTGWFVGDPDEDDAPGVEDLERVAVGELVGARPALLAVLALPPGYIAVLDGDAIEAVLDPDDEVVHPRPLEPT